MVKLDRIVLKFHLQSFQSHQETLFLLRIFKIDTTLAKVSCKFVDSSINA